MREQVPELGFAREAINGVEGASSLILTRRNNTMYDAIKTTQERLEHLDNMADATQCNFTETIMYALVSIANLLNEIKNSLNKESK